MLKTKKGYHKWITLLVPEVGVEPTIPKELEFESSASANSATPASANGSIKQVWCDVKKLVRLVKLVHFVRDE